MHQDVDKTNRLRLDDNLKECESAKFIAERSLFLKTMNSKFGNQVSKVMSLLDLPAEIIRLIALDLEFTYLVRFQRSSKVIFAVTSDVSFYYEYSLKHFQEIAIKKIYWKRKLIPNWKCVVERLYGNKFEYAAQFFYQNAISYDAYKKFYVPPMTGSELERIGYELGDIFQKVHEDIAQSKSGSGFRVVHKKVLKAREENQLLMKNPYWHFFEDILYDSFMYSFYWNLDFYYDVLDFAKRNKYELLQWTAIGRIGDHSIERAAFGTIHFDEFTEHLMPLFELSKSLESFGVIGLKPKHLSLKALPTFNKVSEFLLKEIVGKKRNNYALFFCYFIQQWMNALHQIVTKEEYRQDQLDALKVCLRWRFVIPNGSWRLTDSNSYQLVCLVDESLRSIIYPKGFYMKYLCWREMVRLLTYGCSKNFRNACEKYLYSSDLACHDNELVVEAREACRLHAKKQTEDG